MAEKSTVDLIEDWQTGFFLILGCAVVGLLVGAIVSSFLGPPGFFLGFLGGGILAFLAYAYLSYGR
ncbi:hypothetical protein ACFQH6_17505 [Halobacteriaceae archaeon GCM10025711]